MVGINAYHVSIVFGSSLSNGLIHITAAAEDDLGAIVVPAINESLQLGRGGVGVTILPGVVQLNSLAHLSGSSIGALSEAVTVANASGVGAAAAAGEAELFKAFLNNSVTGQVAALLLGKDDTGNISADRTAINKEEGNIGILGSDLLKSSLLQEAGGNNSLGTVVAGSLHGVIAVLIGGLIAIGGHVVLVAEVVVGSIQLNAIEGALVEGTILQLANIGDEADLILAVLGGHLIGDLIGVGDDSGGGIGGGIRIGGGSGLLAAGYHGKYHDQSESDCKNLFHLFLLQKILFLPRRRCGGTKATIL